jgi:hypothetical protein
MRGGGKVWSRELRGGRERERVKQGGRLPTGVGRGEPAGDEEIAGTTRRGGGGGTRGGDGAVAGVCLSRDDQCEK